MRWLHGWILMAAMAVVMAACTDTSGLLPSSGGRAYEVVVAAGNGHGSAAAALRDMLSRPVVEGLPQCEPQFDVLSGGDMAGATKYSRAIVMADINPREYSETRIRYEKNVYARPQIIIYVGASSVERLRADSSRIQKAVGKLLNRFELNVEIAALGKSRNRVAERVVDSIFGRGIWIPADMQAMKVGRDFVWLSDNSVTAMRNVCVYAYPGSTLDAAEALKVRDSVMRANIHGQAPDMYMCVAMRPEPVARIVAGAGERPILETRGLWEMRGDAMGGPFVSHAVVDSPRGRIVVAEAFVFAPGKKKRNLIRQLEAALYTLK